MDHPLLGVLHAAAAGDFPPDDGGVTWLPALPGDRSAVIALTGHAFIATSCPADAVPAVDGFGGAVAPAALLALARGGWIGEHDVTLVAAGLGGGGLGGGGLAGTDRYDAHPRVALARRQRTDVSVHGDERGLVTVSTGLAGRREVGVEVLSPGHGVGASLIADALTLVATGVPVFAAVSPGNARSLRAFLRAGFVPIGSEVLIGPPS